MKKTKLYIKTIVLAICIVCCSFVNVNAQQPIQIKENGILYKIVESNPKIEDEQILLTMAKNNTTERENRKFKEIYPSAKLVIDDTEQPEDPLLVTELLSKEVSLDNQNSKETYATTIISELAIENNTLSVVSDYSKTEKISSSGGEVYLYTTLFYETGKYDGINYIALRKVTVKAQVRTGLVKVDYVKARGGYKGYNLYTNKFVDRTFSWYQNTGFEVSTPNYDGAILECTSGGIFYSVWGEGFAHVTRQSSSWTMIHKVIESDSGTF